MEPGESELAALVREVAEELGIDIELGARVGDDVDVVGGGAVLRVWLARIVRGDPHPTEHAALRWLGAHELYDVPWLPPDVPVVDALAVLLRRAQPEDLVDQERNRVGKQQQDQRPGH